jgi:hypothetical protein
VQHFRRCRCAATRRAIGRDSRRPAPRTSAPAITGSESRVPSSAAVQIGPPARACDQHFSSGSQLAWSAMRRHGLQASPSPPRLRSLTRAPTSAPAHDARSAAASPHLPCGRHGSELHAKCGESRWTRSAPRFPRGRSPARVSHVGSGIFGGSVARLGRPRIGRSQLADA